MRSVPGRRPDPAVGSLPAPEPVAECLLIQVAAKEPFEVLRLADRPGSGVVFTGAGAIEAIQATRRHGWKRPLLADRRRYTGPARVRGTVGFAPSWLAGQRDAGVSPVLTDSGYVADGDVTALLAILGQAAEAGPDVTAVLPLHERWLHEGRATLIAEVIAHDVPVALVLERADDPLATAQAMAGLTDLLRSASSVALLGAGIGGLAALAFGAQWAAVGVRASLRSYRPADCEPGSPRRRRRWRPAPREIVAAPVLSFSPIDAVVSACAASGANVGWACRCSSCQGRTPEWLASAAALDADAHTVDVLLRHAERVRRHTPGPAREQAWRRQCRQALGRHDELGLAALGWQPSGVLMACAAFSSGHAPKAEDQIRARGRRRVPA